MIALFIFANFLFLIYWMECERRAAGRIRRNKEARKLFWRVMRAHSCCSGIPAPVMVATFDNLVAAGQLLYDMVYATQASTVRHTIKEVCEHLK